MEKVTNGLFNTPLEIGLRLIHIFNATNKALDLQRLIYYNYLIIHSADIDGAPNSIHPALPNRACEMLVSRKIIKSGLNLLISKGIIRVVYSNSGIKYKSNPETSFVNDHFNSKYSEELKMRAKWLIDHFDILSDSKLSQLMNENIGKWGSEFTASRLVFEDA